MEQWKPIKGYEGYYEVSDKGNVRSVDRLVTHKNGTICKYKGCVLKQDITKKGYKKVYLTKDGKKKNYLVHRLVLETFNPVENMDALQVNHKDGNKQNNCLSNLEWCDNYSNYSHALKKGLRPNKLLPKPVAQLTLNGEIIAIYPSISQCSKATGIKDSRISDVCYGRRKTAKGYKFKFV